MKLQSLIRGHKDLKKNGYKMLRKLHKMEKKKGAKRAYATSYEDVYMFVLYCEALVDIIKTEYNDREEYVLYFEKKSKRFLVYLNSIAETKSKMNKSRLARFLKVYTRFFNKIINKNYTFYFDQGMIEKWNLNCLMGFVATWGA